VKLAEAKQLLDRNVDPGSRAVAERVAERGAETVEGLVAAYLDRYARPRKVIPVAGHFLPREAPEAVVAAVKELGGG
jgi:pimeloyl-ACP methyl ester carboxylesterase